MESTFWMDLALKEARRAAEKNEVPIGALLIKENQIIAKEHNYREKTSNPLHHAEIRVLEKAAKKLGDWRLSGCRLFVTLEPCPMCLGALLQARVDYLAFGCFDPKRKKDDFFPSLKGIEKITANNHTLILEGPLLEKECSAILKDFFKARRKNKN